MRDSETIKALRRCHKSIDGLRYELKFKVLELVRLEVELDQTRDEKQAQAETAAEANGEQRRLV